MTALPESETDLDPEGVASGDAPPTEVLPWYHSALNLVALLAAVAVLAGGIGWVVGNNRALPDPNATDIGFLQDMRYHHEQAVQMALIYLDDPDGDANLTTIAREIIVGQNIEIGRFIQLLRDFGESEVNETDLAMAWMGEPVDLDRMPGMATEDDLVALSRAEGADADELFVTMMTAHHLGGVHMAEWAETNAATEEVRLVATQMAKVQREEVDELARLLQLSTGG